MGIKEFFGIGKKKQVSVDEGSGPGALTQDLEERGALAVDNPILDRHQQTETFIRRMRRLNSNISLLNGDYNKALEGEGYQDSKTYSYYARILQECMVLNREAVPTRAMALDSLEHPITEEYLWILGIRKEKPDELEKIVDHTELISIIDTLTPNKLMWLMHSEGCVPVPVYGRFRKILENQEDLLRIANHCIEKLEGIELSLLELMESLRGDLDKLIGSMAKNQRR